MDHSTAGVHIYLQAANGGVSEKLGFHFGGDTQRLETFYKREGQLTFANTNNFIAPNALIKIEVNPKAIGISK